MPLLDFPVYLIGHKADDPAYPSWLTTQEQQETHLLVFSTFDEANKFCLLSDSDDLIVSELDRLDLVQSLEDMEKAHVRWVLCADSQSPKRILLADLLVALKLEANGH